MKSKTRTILLAAVLATPLGMIASSAHAQYRVDTGGALDANNRIGSNGGNDARPSNTISGNDIVTGNVTGGRQFRGNIGYSAPTAFRGGSVGVNTDRFVRQSSTAYEPNAQAVRPFYGTSNAAPPPSGFTQTTTSSGEFIQSRPLSRSAGDLRLGQVTDLSAQPLPQPGELMLPGQVDSGNSQSLITASPLYGIRSDDGATLDDQTSFLSRYSNLNRGAGGDRLSENKTIQAMRDELSKNVISDNPNDAAANPPVSPNDLSTKAQIGKPYESPEVTSLNGKRLGSPLTGGALEGKVTSDQSTRNQLVPAPVQSEQYAELSRRLKTLKNTSPTDQQLNDQFQKDRRVRATAVLQKSGKTGAQTRRPGAGDSGNMIPAAPGGTGEMGGANNATTPEQTLPPQEKSRMPDTAVEQKAPTDAVVPPPAPAKPAETPKTTDGVQGPSLNSDTKLLTPGQPLQVKSLTDGMKPSGLRDTLTVAEDQMKRGKYTSALDQYDLAERVAPNNPLISLGRAHAELGASYYARAEGSIRRALASDEAIMLAQFDLNQFLSQKRVEFLEKDLKDITTSEPKSVRAPFLLAYLKYNTGDSKMAANYLALSEKRAGKPDPLYKKLRVYWDLPVADPIPDAEELNK